MGALCSCCSADTDDEANEQLLSEPLGDPEARRKAADAALRRAGSLAQRLRPAPKPGPPRNSGSGGGDAYSEGGMRWTAG